MDTLHILLITHGLPPESVGGVEQHVTGLADALRAAGHDVEIFARSSRGGPEGSLIEEGWHGCRVTRSPYRWESLHAMVDMYRSEVMDAALCRFLDKRRVAGHAFDVAHIHHLTGLSTGFVDILQERGIRIVLTLHDYWLMCPRGQMWHREEHPCHSVEPAQCAACLTPALGHWLPPDRAVEIVTGVHDLARATLRGVERLLTPSARTIPFFERLGIPAADIGVVENGVDTIALEAVAPPPIAGPLRIGYLGTLIPSKGLDVLIAAFLRAFPATEGHPSRAATLAVHGNFAPYHGDDGFQDRAFGQVPAGAPVHYHGEYTTADLPGLLADIDVLCAPALWHEAFGLTVREAQAAGRPVVVSRIGGLQDAVEDGVEGFVVTPGDVSELADRLTRLAADRGLVRTMGAAARRRTRGFAEMAAELCTHYRGAAKLDPRRAGT